MKTAETQTFSNVWDAIEDNPAEAEVMKLKANMLMAIQDNIRASGSSQQLIAKALGIKQPRVSDLMNGKLDKFSLDKLVRYAAALNMKPTISTAA